MAGAGGGEADDGSKRRLPSWMAGLTVHKSSDTGDHGGADFISNSNETSNFPAKSKSKTRRGTKSTQPQQQQLDDDIINIPQKKRKVREPAPTLKKKKLKETQTRCVDEIRDDDYGEELSLTVEDLLSIAKEYVQESDSQIHSPIREFDSEKELPRVVSANRGTEAPAASSEQSLLSVNRTDDPAQDMLDLFLGPLLKKPVEGQTRTKFIAKDVDIEFRMLSQTQKKHDDGQERVVAPTKTKSSLRDKVAMLLE